MAPPLHIHVVPGDEAPLYRQLVRQIAEGISMGSLEPGERLPSLRELAERLVVAPLTVKKAYDELEARGLIESRRGQGTFVRAGARRKRAPDAERVRPLVRRLLLEADLGGVGQQELLHLIAEERSSLLAEREERRPT